LSLPDVEEMMAVRGTDVSYETIRCWTLKFGQTFARNSHFPIRRRERKQQRFKSQGSAQCFLATHGAVYNVFNYQRHLISRKTLRQLRSQADETWALATPAA
jgi:transposase-like protein